MASIFGRLLAITLALALAVTVSRDAGARQPGGAQLAYGYHDRITREAATYLLDTHRRVQVRLGADRSSVKLIGWLNPHELLVEMNGQLARFQIGRGWHVSAVCSGSPCILMIIAAGQFVGTWQGRSGADLAPQWSPDRQQIAFMRRIGNGFALSLYITGTTQEPRRVTRRGVMGLNFFWRPCQEVGCSRG
jgi:hypothetical protein